VITEDTIRELAAFDGGGVPVTSCYLDVDGRRLPRHQDVEHELDGLLRPARTRANGTPSVHHDLRRIESYVRSGIDRSRTRGLAIFACSAHDLWQVLPLPVPVRSRVVINAVPAVGQLESVVQEYEPFGVLLADKQRARMFVFELGELIDRSELFDELPRDYDQRGEKERGHHAGHVEALTSQHVRRAADVAFQAHQQHAFECLCLGGPDEIVSSLESVLHPYLRDRLCGRIAVHPGASVDEIRRAALEVETRQERAKEAALVGRLRDAVGAGHKGVAGLDRVLSALAERRVEHLLVSDGYTAPGWRCRPCATLATLGRRCKLCGAEMEEIDDVVEEAVDEAMAQSCRVEVCVGNADLDVLGQVGALLRY
jgi:peptide subunit release factor 1 (eRF1)